MTIEFFGSFSQDDKSIKTLMAINGCKLTAVSFRGFHAFQETNEISGKYINEHKALLDGYLDLYINEKRKEKKNNPDMKFGNFYIKYEDCCMDNLLPRLAVIRTESKTDKKPAYKKPVSSKNKKQGNKQGNNKKTGSKKNKK